MVLHCDWLEGSLATDKKSSLLQKATEMPRSWRKLLRCDQILDLS